MNVTRRARVGALLMAMGALIVTTAGSPSPASAQAAADAAPAASDSQASEVLGNWLTADRDGIIAISRQQDGRYEGRIVGGDSPDRLDDRNPNPALRGQHLLGLVILRDMAYVGHGRWSGGTIYDPDSGHTYRCRLQLLGPDRLKVRGFLGVALLGRSQVWTRFTGSSLQLPPHR